MSSKKEAYQSKLKLLVLKLAEVGQLDQNKIEAFKRKWAKVNGFMPKNTQLIQTYRDLVDQDQLKPDKSLEKNLRLKQVRSLSGIVPVAVLTKPYECPGRCVYCPSQKGIPKSYLDDEPAVMRAKMADFDPYLQVKRRLSQLEKTGHSTQKIELIVMGGTFSWLPWAYQVEFISQCFRAASQRPKLNFQNTNLNQKLALLEASQQENEKAKRRIIGLTLETRPDQINEKEVKRMRLLGGTRVEIGVQSVFEPILRKVNRGHGLKETVQATRLLKDAGFKVCYHLMPNLPGSSLKKDLKMFKKVFADPRFKPDMLKIYPCVVVYQAELYNWLKEGRFKPYSDKQLIDLLIKIKTLIPPWVRINRLGRDIPVANIAAGFKLSNIRQILKRQMAEKDLECQCIRCREIRGEADLEDQTLEFKDLSYQASGGKEHFFQFVNQEDKLYGLLRLRIPSPLKKNQPHFIPALDGAALVRELHVYGRALPLTEIGSQAAQHQGLGKKLLLKAESAAKASGAEAIAVISGIGARQYYRKLGYRLEGTYMVKKI